MIKKIVIMILAFFSFIQTQTFHAQAVKEISLKEFLKVQRWFDFDPTLYQYKGDIFYIIISIGLLLLIIITSIYIFQKFKQLKWIVVILLVSYCSVLALSYYNEFTIPKRLNSVTNNMIVKLNNKTFMEQNTLLDHYADNDYGFSLSNIHLSSDILEPGKKYTLSFKVYVNKPWNFMGQFSERYFKRTFKYTGTKGIKLLTSQYVSAPYKVVKTNNTKINQFNTYCFDQNQLDWFNSRNISLVGMKDNQYSVNKFEYVELYSNAKTNVFCGKIYYDQKPYILYDDNVVGNLVEVK